MSSICKCGAIATTLVEYEDGEVEPVCEACFQERMGKRYVLYKSKWRFTTDEAKRTGQTMSSLIRAWIQNNSERKKK